MLAAIVDTSRWQTGQGQAGIDSGFALVVRGRSDDGRNGTGSCVEVDQDRYGRIVADCFRDNREPVDDWPVRRVHAVDWARYSKAGM